MNQIIYSLFTFQFCVILTISLVSVVWQNNVGILQIYLSPGNSPHGLQQWFVTFLTVILRYSHIMPISLYVAVELFKVFLTIQIEND